MNKVYDKLAILSRPTELNSLSSIDLDSNYTPGTIVLSIDSHNLKHCLFPISGFIEPKRISRGFSFQTRVLRDNKNSHDTNFLDLKWHDPNEIELFVAVVEYLTTKVKEENKLVEDIISIVRKWDYYLSNDSTDLVFTSALGLFAELEILKSLLTENLIDSSLNEWTGPNGSRHDFELSNICLEVKASISNNYTIEVSSLDQLERHNHKRLNIIYCNYKIDDAGENLWNLVDSFKIFGYEIWKEVLRKVEMVAGTSNLDGLKNYGFKLHKAIRYEITPDFPALTNPKLEVLGLQAISKAKYSINLLNCAPANTLESYKGILDEA